MDTLQIPADSPTPSETSMTDAVVDLAAFSINDISTGGISADEFRLYGSSVLGPAWRWRKAQRFVAFRREPRRLVCDTAYWTVVDHVRRLPSELRARLCGDCHLDVAAAETVYCDPAMRLQVEARLLSGMTPEMVASLCGVTGKTVRDYCEIFFDILDRRDAKDWLAAHVFDLEIGCVNELHMVVCQAAYQGGPTLCEHWLERLPHLNDDCDLATAHGREIKRLQLALGLHRLRRAKPNRLAEIAMRVGNLSQGQPPRFVSLSQALGQRTAQKLSELLGRDEDALQVVQIEFGSHMTQCDKKASA